MIYLILIFLGLALGSFVNALVWRIHEQSKRKRPAKELSVLTGRSMCPSCKHTLAWHDLLPVVSWLSLAGKCRYCHRPISAQYPAVEVLTAVLFVLSYLLWPYGFDQGGVVLFSGWLIVLAGLVALTLYDFRWMLLPDRIVYPLTVLWFAIVLVQFLRFDGSLWPLAGAITIFGTFWIIYQVSDGKWIGGGDVKLGLLLGMLAGGLIEAFMVIFLASIIGIIAISPMLLTRKVTPTSRIPFGPFLMCAAVIIFLSGNGIETVLREYLLLY